VHLAAGGFLGRFAKFIDADFLVDTVEVFSHCRNP
jgi:hypothetical protein